MASPAERPRQQSDNPLNANRFAAMDILSMLCLLAVVIAVNNFAKKRAWPVPDAILTMGVGTAAGGLVALMSESTFQTFRTLDEVAAMQFLTIWLAPIIFAEGYAMRTREFFDNIARILVHAFLGTAISAVVVAVAVLYLAPLMGIEAAGQLNFAECLTFGAMISATDPVTTLAIFKQQRMAENGLGHLYYSVLGESVLNDAVGITLFSSFSKLVLRDQVSLDGSDILQICLEFAWTFVGSMIIGGVMGLAMPLVLKYTPLGNDIGKAEAHGTPEAAEDSGSESDAELQFNVPEIGVALVMALLPYLIAEALDLSGIVSIMFAGMTARYYAHLNLTKETRSVFLPIVELVAQLCETYVFIILGLGVFLFRGHYSAALVGAATVGCLVGRAVHVYPFSWLINRLSRSEELRMNEQHLVWFAGLRGAIAFICAFSFPETESSQHRYYVICTTIVIVGASLLVMGWPTTTVIRLLGIRPHTSLGENTLSVRSLEGSRRPRQSSMISHRRSESSEDGPEAVGQQRRFSHRRQRSEPSPTQAADEEQDASPTSCVAQAAGGVVRSLDSSLRRLLMTRDAVVERNRALFRKPSKKSSSMLLPSPHDRPRDPLLLGAGSAMGPVKSEPIA